MLGRIRTAIYNTLGCVEQTVGTIRVVGRPPFVSNCVKALDAIASTEQRAVLEQKVIVHDDGVRSALRTLWASRIVISGYLLETPVNDLAAYLAGELVRKRGASARTAAEKLAVEEAASDADAKVAEHLWDRDNIEQSELLRFHANWRAQSGLASCQAAIEKEVFRRAVRRRYGWLSFLVRRRRVFRRTVHGIRLRGTRRFLLATEAALARTFSSSASRLIKRHVASVREQFSGNVAEIRHRARPGGSISIMWRAMRHEPPDRYASILVHEAIHNEFWTYDRPRSCERAVEQALDEELECHSRAYDFLVEIGANSAVIAEEAARVEQWRSGTRCAKQRVREVRAQCAYERGEYDLALAGFDEAIELGCHARANNLAWQACALHKLGRNAQALGVLETAIHEYPDCGELFSTRARIHEELGSSDSALSDWDRAIELKPDPEWTEGRAALLDKLGRPEQAEADRVAATRLAADTHV